MCDIERNFADFNAALCYRFANGVKDSARNVMKLKMYLL
jgi:hypothetical protein